MKNKREQPVMSYAHHHCGYENMIVRFPRKTIEKNAEKQRKKWIKKVKSSPELQKEYDPETGKLRTI